ncbi:MAG: glycine cleavage system aminomethyltransferase GcvT [Hyphomicrobiales bacterium]|nr:glycine cleavage system aminomethyltransferase GcvT [Hyphomicrobiales bacterium]
MADAHPSEPLRHTPLHALHVALGARMVPFAGYDMPVQYPAGIIAEHLHTRAAAGLFDVSHMGQAFLDGPDAARRLETLAPGDIAGLQPGRTRYTQFLNAQGGILDDLMVTQLAPDRLFIVCNASMKEQDFALMRAGLPDLRLDVLDDRALLALQGPQAAAVLEPVLPSVGKLVFMSFSPFAWRGATLFVTRSGYTGEDGYEISVPAALATDFAQTLLANPVCKPAGLGARDSLRLEAGLCLYGHDIDTTTDPVEAAIGWSISKRRRAEGGFPGAARVQKHFAEGAARKRVGLAFEGRAPAREGAEIAAPDGRIVGRVTSGGFAPSLNRPIAMGYVETAFAAPGTELAALVRGKPLAARVAPMPFVPNRYFKG